MLMPAALDPQWRRVPMRVLQYREVPGALSAIDDVGTVAQGRVAVCAGRPGGWGG